MSHDTWFHRLSGFVVRPLVDTPITPNHLTTGRLLSAVAAGACFAVDTGTWNVLGAGMFLVSMLLDRADGMLARMKNASSRFGAFYDLIADAISNFAVFLGLGVASLDGALGPWGLVLGVVTGLSIAAIFTVAVITEAQIGHGAAAFQAHAGFDPDDALIVLPVAVVLGFGDPLLVCAAVCAPVAAVFICRHLYLRCRRPA